MASAAAMLFCFPKDSEVPSGAARAVRVAVESSLDLKPRKPKKLKNPVIVPLAVVPRVSPKSKSICPKPCDTVSLHFVGWPRVAGEFLPWEYP